MRAVWRVAALVLLAGCGAAAGEADPQACAPADSAATERVAAAPAAGEFVLRLVATAGAKRGESAQGQLGLTPHDSASRHLVLPGGTPDTTFSMPLYGSTDVDFATVDAAVPGDPHSLDPASPGVLVMELPGRVILRIGSEANRRGVIRFDGAYTVLRVQQTTDSGFAGSWESGASGQQSSGHFCAVRAES
jgi:hypothetical protein